MKLKADLHLHTSLDPDDGGHMVVHSAEQLIDRASAAGFQVLSITNHNQLLYSGDLRDYARERGILLVPGVEATIEGKHLLLLNFLDYEPGWNSIADVRSAKGDAQLVIAPHPLFPIRTAARQKVFEWLDTIDALEYSSLNLKWLDFNAKAVELARELGKPVVGSSDLHFLYQLGRTCSWIEAEPTVESVIEALRSGRVEHQLCEGGLYFVLKWFAFAALCKARQLLVPSGRHLNPTPHIPNPGS